MLHGERNLIRSVRPFEMAMKEGVKQYMIKTSLHALAQHDEDTAYILFQEAMAYLTEAYLYQ